VIFADSLNSSRIHIQKWDSGTTWQDFGFASTGDIVDPSIAIGTDNMPVVVFIDGDNSGKARIMKLE
jgi:hypothetical protein